MLFCRVVLAIHATALVREMPASQRIEGGILSKRWRRAGRARVQLQICGVESLLLLLLLSLFLFLSISFLVLFWREVSGSFHEFSIYPRLGKRFLGQRQIH